MTQKKNPHKVIHRKLGKERAYGLAHTEDNLIELEISLKGYRYMLYALHEHFHLKHPDWSETKILRESSKTARFMWSLGFRLVDLKG